MTYFKAKQKLQNLNEGEVLNIFDLMGKPPGEDHQVEHRDDDVIAEWKAAAAAKGLKVKS